MRKLTEEKVTTAVCCWGGDVIFVDWSATGGETGASWGDAYSDLQDALTRADGGCGDEIWVAAGVYPPGDDPINDTFRIPAGVSVYGGFAGDETTLTQRDFTSRPTVLSGFISEDEYSIIRNEKVVTMGDESLLDGFVVEEGNYEGITGDGVDYTIANCLVDKNGRHGVYAKDGDLIIQWCKINDNAYHGIYHEGSNYSLYVNNCKVYDNQHDGIVVVFSNAEILNSMIYQNGDNGTYYGINLNQPATSTIIHNNTIVHNDNEGIRFVGTNLPDVRNCILWGNNSDGDQMTGLYPDEINYSYVQDCNDVNYQNNINGDPGFAYSNPAYGLYHLAGDSDCVDAGDTYDGISGLDIDGDDRIYNAYVDMGADEYSCSDVSNTADLTADGIINFKDFGILAAAWCSHDPNDPVVITDPNYSNDPDYYGPEAFVHWDDRVDFDSDYNIGLGDLAYFAEDAYWLWMACWREAGEDVWGMGAMSMVMVPVEQPQEIVEEPTPQEQLAQAVEISNWLENLWKEDVELRATIDKKDWKQFMDSIDEWMSEIESGL